MHRKDILWFPWSALMDVTHHKSEAMFKKYSHERWLHVVNAAWEDLEEESHIARTFNLRAPKIVLQQREHVFTVRAWSQGFHTPPVMLSIPDIITSALMRLEHTSAIPNNIELRDYNIRFCHLTFPSNHLDHL